MFIKTAQLLNQNNLDDENHDDKDDRKTIPFQ